MFVELTERTILDKKVRKISPKMSKNQSEKNPNWSFIKTPNTPKSLPALRTLQILLAVYRRITVSCRSLKVAPSAPLGVVHRSLPAPRTFFQLRTHTHAGHCRKRSINTALSCQESEWLVLLWSGSTILGEIAITPIYYGPMQ